MRPWMLIGLVAALGLTGWMASQEDGAVAQPASRDKQARAPARAGPASKDIKAGHPASKKIDALQAKAVIEGVMQWQGRLPMAPQSASAPGPWDSQLPPPPPPPPPVAVVDATPPPPVAPAFPHNWVGRFNDEPAGDTPSVVQRAVVVGGQSVWVVRVGDVIEGQWRVDQIKDRTMGLTYLPLQQRQSVAMK